MEITTYDLPSQLAKAEVRKATSLIQLNRYIGDKKGTSMRLEDLQILSVCIASLDPNATDLHDVNFNGKKYWESKGITRITSGHLKVLAESFTRLAKQTGWVLRYNPKTQENEAVTVRYFHEVVAQSDGNFTITWDPKIKPALILLRDHFVRYPIEAIIRLSSKYGFMLFDLLMSHDILNAEQHSITLSLEQLAENFDATNYPPARIKERVLEPGIADLRQNCPLLIPSYRLIKTGRGYTHIELSAEPRLCPAENVKKMIVGEGEDHDLGVTADDIKAQIGYNDLREEIDGGKFNIEPAALDLIVETMLEIELSAEESYKINKANIPAEKVREKYRTLTPAHIANVLHTIEAKDDIDYPKAFITTLLFNATPALKKKRNPQNDRRAGGRKIDAEEQAAIERLLKEDSRSDPDIQFAIERLLSNSEEEFV